MFVLHVDLNVRPDSSRALEETFSALFRPAIISQPGFAHVSLLKSGSVHDRYRLVIAFQDETAQKKWVATDLHQEVWPKVEANCSSYEVETFHVL